MKIAIVISRLDISGGAQRQALEFAAHLQKQKHHIDVFCSYLDTKKCYPEIIKDLTVYSVDRTNLKTTSPANSFFSKLKNKINNQFLDENDLLLGELVKKYNDKHQYEIINYHDANVFKIGKFFDKQKNIWMMNDLPFLLDVKRRDKEFGQSTGNTKRRIYVYLRYVYDVVISNFYLRKIGYITVLDERNQSLVKKYFLRSSTVVRSGINHQKFLFAGAKYDNSMLEIVATSIFAPYRRYEDLINALHILKTNYQIDNFHLTIIGESKTEPEYYKTIISLVEKQQLQNYITFLGSTSDEKLIESYQKAAVFVFPSVNQTWGLSVFEAMLSGCAAVMTKGCGAHEVVTDSVNALVTDPKSPEQIAEKISYLIKNRKQLEEIAKAGQQYVQKNLSWDKYSEEMLTVFKKQLSH